MLKDEVRMKANVSSQYISALLLMATKLKNGLTLHLEGKITSVPYIKMTLSLLNQLGVETSFEGQVIQVKPNLDTVSKTFNVESDWSSASYFYSIVALSSVGTQINLKHLQKRQPTRRCSTARNLYTFGVQTTFEGSKINLKKINSDLPKSFDLDLANAPDIAQTIVVTCLGLQIKCNLTGLHTLKIKETDRLEALKNEIYKFGTVIDITDDSLHLSNHKPLKSGQI